jgi:hypothetical protein
MQIVRERGRVDAQLTGEHVQDLGVSVLADVQHATGVARIAEVDREAELRRGSPMPANQPQVAVGERVEAGQGAVIERGEFDELGALGRSEQFAGGHGRARFAGRLPQKTAHLLR